MKKYEKKGRVFLNDAASGCLGAISWNVLVYYQQDYDHQLDKKKETGKWKCNGEIEINEEARGHYVSRKGNLRAVHRMQRELNMFEAAMSKALDDCEEANAKS